VQAVEKLAGSFLPAVLCRRARDQETRAERQSLPQLNWARRRLRFHHTVPETSRVAFPASRPSEQSRKLDCGSLTRRRRVGDGQLARIPAALFDVALFDPIRLVRMVSEMVS